MKSYKIILTAVVIILFVSLSSALYGQKQVNRQISAEFDRILEDQFGQEGSGCTALVAREGKIIYLKAFGMADLELGVPMRPEMVFRIGSITKQFTSVAILQLVEQGRISLQDEITKFIPDYPTQAYKITVENLLTHTSGIKSYTNVPEFEKYSKTDMKPEEVIALFKNQPMEFAPGTKWNYNNSGYFLLGYIIEKVTGKTYQEYLQENFFTPLGMTSTCYGSDRKLIMNRASGYQTGTDGVENSEYLSMTLPYSAGAIMSTVEDLYKWTMAVQKGKLVSGELLERAFTPYKLENGKSTNYGYGWFLSQIEGSPTIEHGGGINGFLTNAIYLPDEDVFVAVFSNSTGKAPEYASQLIAAIAIGKPVVTNSIVLDQESLAAYQGVYANAEGKEITVTLEDGSLVATRSGAQRMTLTPVEKDRFFFDGSITSVQFFRDELGGIIAAESNDRGVIVRWNKTEKEAVARKEVKVSEALLDRYTGDFELKPGFILTFTREGNKLYTQATGQPRFELFAESDTRFFLKVVDAQVEFIIDNDGQVRKMVLYQGGAVMEAKRIR